MLDTRFLKSKRFRRLSKEGFWIILGQAMAVVGALIGVRLVTALLEPAAYGELALGMTVATFVNQTLLGPLSNGVTRFYAPAVEKGNLGGYLSAVRRLVLSATGIIILIILFIVIGLVIAGRTEWIAIASAALFFAILSGYNSILNGFQNASRHRSIVALHQGMESWARFFVAVGFMLWLGATSAVAMVGYAMANILVLGSQYIFLRKIVPGHIAEAESGRSWSKQIWKFAWPYASWGIFSWAQQVSDRWALELFAKIQDVGLYAVLFQLGYYPMSMANGMAMQLLAPIMFQRAGDASDRRRNADVSKLCWRLTWVALGVTGAALCMGLLFHTQIFGLFVDKKYSSISHLLPWMLLSGGLFAAGQTFELNLVSQMKTPTIVVAKIITALLGVLLNFVCAYLFGITGIVFASVLFSVLYSIWMMMLSQRTASEICSQ